MGNRGDVLNQLEVVLNELSEVKTVVRVLLSDFDVTQYAMNQLPLVAISEPAEGTFEEMIGQKSVMELATKLSIYFLHWGISPDAAYKALIKAIRDKLGANFTLNETAIECRVAGVSIILGTMPVYNFTIELETRYYLDETNV